MNARTSFSTDASVSTERAPCKLQIRPIRPSDADVLQSTFEKQSELSRYFRFHSGLRRLPDELLYRLTHVDGIDHVALVAFERCGTAPPAGVGVARFVRDPQARESAELAIAVEDHAQGHGVARRLLQALGAEAQQRGIRTFSMHVVAANARVRRLLASLGAVGRSDRSDVIRFQLPVSALSFA
jgi:GNAT superfamily N-acetyltransferase